MCLDRQPGAPVFGVGIIEITNQPERADNVGLGALFVWVEIGPQHGKRDIDVAMRLLRQRGDEFHHWCDLADLELHADRQQCRACFRVVSEPGDRQLAFALKGLGQPVQQFAMLANRGEVDQIVRVHGLPPRALAYSRSSTAFCFGQRRRRWWWIDRTNACSQSLSNQSRAKQASSAA